MLDELGQASREVDGSGVAGVLDGLVVPAVAEAVVVPCLRCACAWLPLDEVVVEVEAAARRIY